MDVEAPSPPPPAAFPRRVLGILALAAAYAAGGRLGLELSTVQDNTTLVWPSTGIAIAALLLYGRGLWPGVFAGALVINLAVGPDLVTALAIATGNTLEALAAATLLGRSAGFRPDLARIRDVGAFLAVAAFCASPISATVGWISLRQAGALPPGAAGEVWLQWWLGDLGGAMAVAPLILVGLLGRPAWPDLLRRGEAWLVFVLSTATTAAAWFEIPSPHMRLLSLFAPFALLVWAGVRLGPRGAVTVGFATTVVAVLGVARGYSPFGDVPPAMGPLLLWAWCASLSAGALLLAAATSERDAAEERHAQEARARRSLEAQVMETQRLESLGLLAGGVAHDFNNILMVIQANADFVREQAESGRIDPHRLDQIDTAVQRAADLCARLLTVAGRGTPAVEPVDLGQVVGELNTLIGATVSRKITFDLHVEDALPAVHGDVALLRQVFMNLLVNAVEAIGEAEGVVSVVLRSAGANVRADVRDTGRGMDDETRRHVFEPFFSTKSAGRGLGLASVRGIVLSHNGSIDLASSLGRGTCFTVCLPASPARVRAAPRADRPLAARGSGRSILVTDDEPSLRRALRAGLERAGFEVVEAADGVEALALVDPGDPRVDLVLLDMNMPRMGGAETLRRVRERAPDLPVILMSGYAAEAMAALGADGVLPKPFPFSALVELITRVFEERGELPAPTTTDIPHRACS